MKNESKTFEYILMIEICRLPNEIFNHVQYLNGVDFRKKEIFLPHWIIAILSSRHVVPLKTSRGTHAPHRTRRAVFPQRALR